ncbi:MAG: MFS transporter [Opitutales bacterium]
MPEEHGTTNPVAGGRSPQGLRSDKADARVEQVALVNNANATYRYDKIKAPFLGILEAGWSTFALLIAIRYFDANETAKALIAGSGPIGFLITPVTLFLAARMSARPNLACALVFGTAAVLLLGASLAQSLLYFTLFATVSQVSAVQQGPLMLQIYTENYTTKERGTRMTVPFILTALFSIGFSIVGGKLLDWRIESYHLIFIVMFFACLASAWSCSRIPSIPLSREHVGNPWQNISLIWKDGFFGFLLGSWMLLGLGNLIALPIRVEYLADPKYGINADNTTIAILMMVIPAITRILSTKMWGRFFDRLHFVTTRNLLNLFFLMSIALFFFSTNPYLLGLAMVCQGLAMGGGKIFWSLWVTKIAPEQKASSYMSIHMALTGLRGTIAPFLGYWILSQSSPKAVAIIGVSLITVSMVLFQLVRGHKRLETA